jgi:hypothetical protein
VTPEEADGLLSVIAQRAATGQTGAAWQRAALAAAEAGADPRVAAALMFQRYLKNAATAQPVHTWPV